MKHENNITVISRDGMFASALNGFIGYIFGDDKQLWREMVAMRLHMIKPQSTKTDQEINAGMFVYFVANITHNIEIEAEMLNLFSAKPELKEQLSRVDYSPYNMDDELARSITPMLVSCLLNAGVKDLEGAFGEIDHIALEFGITEMDEVGVKEALHGKD
ncbi:MAG: hypothetical protein Q8J85_04720 [Sulfuricurvum sp.]|nr:hypothetical protein [Sulfuricurvum sp.]MDP3022708.1 hypothetical protein [Sulfuricurvum sp.]